MAKNSTSEKEPSTFKLMLHFLKSKKFLISFGIAILFVILSYPLINWYLSSSSNHGEKITVPELVDRPMEQLDSICKVHGLRYSITDSIFNRNGEKGIVLVQDPRPGDFVKSNRTIYVSVSRVLPEMIKMSNLLDKQDHHAIGLLTGRGLKVKEVIPRPAICDGCVLEQLYNGQPIDSGAPVPFGASITLVIGQKEANTKKSIPDLSGLTILEATQRLNGRSLNLGEPFFEDCVTPADSAAAKVYKQSPKHTKYGTVPIGSEVDLWLSPKTQVSVPSDSTSTSTK